MRSPAAAFPGMTKRSRGKQVWDAVRRMDPLGTARPEFIQYIEGGGPKSAVFGSFGGLADMEPRGSVR
eukprot:4117764-Alexandrium_andersonii.AAC.1